ncbi:MAG: HAMP domain-containing histidine kinase [Eubacteriaceae bacterium]|jgi:signal transduction histidine kinase|nr:HAMP domain-containing histidine kinase [Eubacteriaceae bacterium]
MKISVGDYLKSRARAVILFAVMLALFTCTIILGGAEPAECIYPAVVCTVLFVIFMIIGYFRYSEKLKALQEIENKMQVEPVSFPQACGAVEEEYQKMLGEALEMISRIRKDADSGRADMTDYYTMWVHQIKTPLSAMYLMIENSNIPEQTALRAELFKIEQYVDMVMQYLRLSSEQTDFIFSEHDLDKIIKETVKKFAVIFISRKISLNYEPCEQKVLTDEKWLSFVLGQIISNALKYTKEGSVSIYAENTSEAEVIIVQDTGIGIRQEDIPRIFDKGYTGYNGRGDKRASGLGLYLCRNVLEKMGDDIKIESEPGKGTKVSIIIPYMNVRYE